MPRKCKQGIVRDVVTNEYFGIIIIPQFGFIDTRDGSYMNTIEGDYVLEEVFEWGDISESILQGYE